MRFLTDFINGDNDEFLFFILVFLLLLNNGFFLGERGHLLEPFTQDDMDISSSVIFFISLFILLFFSNTFTAEG